MLCACVHKHRRTCKSGRRPLASRSSRSHSTRQQHRRPAIGASVAVSGCEWHVRWRCSPSCDRDVRTLHQNASKFRNHFWAEQEVQVVWGGCLPKSSRARIEPTCSYLLRIPQSIFGSRARRASRPGGLPSRAETPTSFRQLGSSSAIVAGHRPLLDGGRGWLWRGKKWSPAASRVTTWPSSFGARGARRLTS